MAFARIDEILATHAAALGGDFTGYRNHAQRVARICAALAPADEERREKIAIAAAFHDLGIWTDDTLDYLGPSARAAAAYLESIGRIAWWPEITEAIVQHHRIRPWRGEPASIVEPFRRADLVDVTRGLVTFGVRRALLRELYAEWPGAGFHRRLVRLELAHLRKHPLRPLPMVRW